MKNEWKSNFEHFYQKELERQNNEAVGRKWDEIENLVQKKSPAQLRHTTPINGYHSPQYFSHFNGLYLIVLTVYNHVKCIPR